MRTHKLNNKSLKKSPPQSARILLFILFLISIVSYLAFDAVIVKAQVREYREIFPKEVLEEQQTINYVELPKPEIKEIQAAEVRKAEGLKKEAAAQKAAQARAANINRILVFLRKQGSIIASYEYAAIIYDRSKASGADYRFILAVMGVESGFCNASFSYNCFGYLNGVKYTSYTQSLNALIPKVAGYARKYGTNFEAFCKAYGIMNVEAGVAKLTRYYYGV